MCRGLDQRALMGTVTRVRGQTPRPWAVGCNRFAVKSHDRQHMSLRRRRYTPQPRVAALAAPWEDDTPYLRQPSPPPCPLGAAPLQPPPRRAHTPLPRFPWSAARPYAEGVAQHSPGSPRHVTDNICPYAAGVIPHSPGSAAGHRCAAAVGGTPWEDALTPKALHNTAQGRRALRRTLGHGHPHASLRRRRYTPQPRVSRDPAMSRRTLGRRQGPDVPLRRRRCTTQPRVAALRGGTLGSRTPTCVLTPKALYPTAQGQPPGTASQRSARPWVARPWEPKDKKQTNPEGVSQVTNMRINPTHIVHRPQGHISGKADGIRPGMIRPDDVPLDWRCNA